MEDLQFQLEEEVLSKEDIMVGTTSYSPNLFGLFYGLCLYLLVAVNTDQFITVQCGIFLLRYATQLVYDFQYQQV